MLDGKLELLLYNDQIYLPQTMLQTDHTDGSDSWSCFVIKIKILATNCEWKSLSVSQTSDAIH